MPGFLNDIAGGAASGSTLGPLGTAAGAALGLAPSLIGLFTGGAQRRRGRRMKPVDPGFVANQGLLDNQQITNNLYNNFQLPGKSGIISNLEGAFATGVSNAERAATSSSDLLGAVTDMNFNKNNTLLDLGIKEAGAKQDLLPMVLESNAAAGNEAVRRNQYEQEKYQAELREKAALEQAGATNQFKSIDNLATVGGSLLNYKADPWVNKSTWRKPVVN